MQRLTSHTLAPFLASPEIAIVLVGAAEGRATMAQAEEFALLWAERRNEARFAYVDGLELSPWAALAVLPTTLIFGGGVEIVRLEGLHPRRALADALDAGAAPGRCAA